MTADLQQQPQAPAPEAPAPDTQQQQPSAEQPELAQSEPTADAKPQEGEPGDKQVRRHISSIQKRIDELTRDRHEAARRAEAAEQRAAELEGKLRSTSLQAEEPRLEQFDNVMDYAKALASFEAKKQVSEALGKFNQEHLQTFEQRQNQERAAHAAQQFDHALSAVEKDGGAKFKDFAEVVASGPKLGPQIGAMVLSTDAPAEISYYLAKNPEHGLALASMPPMLAMREIGKLEAQFTSKRVTSAPPPPKTVGQAGKASTGLSDDLSSDEWYRRRQAQLRKG